MHSIPILALPLLCELAPVFTQPTYQRAVVLLFASLLTTGRRTIANLLRTAGHLAPGNPSLFRRVLSGAAWSGLYLAACLTRFAVTHCCPQQLLELVADDTVDEHRGKKVHGKARHRDPIRSSRSYTTWRYGHKWVVLALLVRFPFASRLWALPILIFLYRGKDDPLPRKKHRTPCELVQLQLRVLLRWLPEKTLRFVGDQGYGSHDMAVFAQSQGGRLTLVSRFWANANLYEPPPAYTGKGRPRVKGAKMPSPAQVAASAPRRPLNVAWYGGGRRDIEVVTGVGHWYKSGRPLVQVRWVFVHDLTGTHRDEYFYSTDIELTPTEIIETYTRRWNIETTFQETRAYLGLETTRGWCHRTVVRAAPCLFGMYTVVTLWYVALREAGQRTAGIAWENKSVVTFSDAMSTVRRWLWTDWLFQNQGHGQTFANLPAALQEIVLQALAPAA